MILQILFFILVLISSSCHEFAFADEYYPYEPSIVKLEGLLYEEQKFGPPNFGETPEKDEHIKIYVIFLDHPITVGAPESFSELNADVVKNISNIQVIFKEKTNGTVPVGKVIVLKGQLSQQISSSDYYPIVLRDVVIDKH